MEKVRPWCGRRSDRGRLKNRTEQSVADAVCVCVCVVPSCASVRLLPAPGPARLLIGRGGGSRCPLHAASDSAERRGIDGWAGWRGTVT